jgi:arylsulfatase
MAGLHVHPPISGWGKFELDEWELYDLEHDRSQSKNVADAEPVRLETLKSLWFYYAGIYNGLPLDDRSALEQMLADRPHGAPELQQYTYYPHVADVPEAAGVAINGRRTRRGVETTG